MRSLIVTGLLLLSGSVWPTDWKDLPGLNDTTTISSLPATCAVSGTTDSLKVYVLSGNLSSDDGAITVNDISYIKIAGGGDTATFDCDSSGGVSGITFVSGADHIVIESLTVQQYQTVAAVEYGSYGGSNVSGITFSVTLEWIYIKDCNVHVSGHSSRNVEATGGAQKGIEIYGGNYTSWVNSFDSRSSADAAVMRLSYGAADPDTFNYYVHDVTIDSACHAGLLVGDLAWVDSNYVTLDIHNEKPATYWSNAHAIADAGGNWPGSRFVGNVIRTGTNHYGGRGMYFNETEGTAENPIHISYNDVQVTQGSTGGEATAARGLRIRWDVNYLKFHDNIIKVWADDDAGTDHIESDAHGMWITNQVDTSEGKNIGQGCEFYNNHIEAIWLGTGTHKYVSCVYFENTREDTNNWGNDYWLHNNHYKSNCFTFWFAYGNEAHEVISYRDTFYWDSPHFTADDGNRGSIAFGGGINNSYDCWIIDPIFPGYEKDSIAKGSNNEVLDSEVWLKRTIKVTVLDTFSNPIQACTVKFVNNYSDTTGDKPTSAQGIMYDTLSSFYRYWDDGGHSDSTFNDYTFFTYKNGDSTDSVITVDESTNEGTDFLVTLVLQNAGGIVQHHAKMRKAKGRKVRMR